MGLDMFLKRKLPTWGCSVTVVKEDKTLPFIDSSKVDSITEQVGYWRKFNALHNWFVENVQGGHDECQTSEVTIEQLQKLLHTLKRVQEIPELAENLLPTTEGFFFGGTEYDEHYFEEISDTIELLESLVSDHEKYDEWFEYFYRASW